MKKKRRVLRAVCLLLGVFILAGLDTRLVLRNYRIGSEKLTGTVRVALLTDLHSCDYGEGQRALLKMVEAQEPDLVLLGGDWVDDNFGRLPPERAYETARALAEKWPTYYVCGNHEVWCGYEEEIKAQMAVQGVQVLEGESREVTVRGQRLLLCGMDDPSVGEGQWAVELEAMRGVAERADGEACTLLLSHRPERIGSYGGFDVVLTGHAHGGQWRLPGLIDGLFAPDQGWFPAYTGGAYPVEGGGTLIVSRGLARESTRVPRFYNRPEVVVVDLAPAV